MSGYTTISEYLALKGVGAIVSESLEDGTDVAILLSYKAGRGLFGFVGEDYLILTYLTSHGVVDKHLVKSAILSKVEESFLNDNPTNIRV